MLNELITPKLLSYKGEIINKVYPGFYIKSFIKELKSIFQEICYSPVWSSGVNDIYEWQNQIIPSSRFKWLHDNSEKYLPQFFIKLNNCLNDNLSGLSIDNTAELIITAKRELLPKINELNKACEKRTVKSSKDVLSFKQSINGKPESKLIKDFIKEIEELKPEGLKAVLLHGSIADGQTVSGFSDFDVHYIINIPDDKVKFVELMKWIFTSNYYLLSFNPFMHHGPMIVFSEELMINTESALPSILIEKGVWLYGKYDEFYFSDSAYDDISSFIAFKNFFENQFTKVPDIKNFFDVIWWTSSIFFLPLLYTQMISQKSMWKRDILTEKKNIPKQYWDLFDKLSSVRDNVGNYLSSRIRLPLELEKNNLNPGLILAKYKNLMKLAEEEIIKLGITNEMIDEGINYFHYCEREAIKANNKNFLSRGYKFKKVAANSIKDVTEVPYLVNRSFYDKIKNVFLEKCFKNKNVVSVYEFGKIGAPGLSDLDLLVVLSDDFIGIPENLTIAGMDKQYAEIINHDPLFISFSSAEFLGSVFPLFNARKIYGKDLKLKLSNQLNFNVQAILYTFINVLKYPEDILRLTKEEKIRWRTLLAYFNSFNHVVKAFKHLQINIPNSLEECVQFNKKIRNNFTKNILSLEDLDEAINKMLIASGDIILAFENLWITLMPELKEIYGTTEREQFLDEINNTFLGKSHFHLPSVIRAVMNNIQKTDDHVNIDSKTFEKFSNIFSEYFYLKNSFIEIEAGKGRDPNYYIIGKKFSTLPLEIELPDCSLATVEQLESSQFTWFMFKLNCFAFDNSLRRMINWSKVWEYPWIWFKVFNNINVSGKVIIDLGSELSPIPWVLALNGAKVILIETDKNFIPVWEELNRKYNVSVEWQIVSDEKIPFQDNMADIITSFSVIEHQPLKEKAVEEVVRVLKPEGIFALSFDICEDDMGMSFPDWNGKALSMQEFESVVWNNSNFVKSVPPVWNTSDIPSFWKWHLKSAKHHNYVTAASVLKNQKHLNIKTNLPYNISEKEPYFISKSGEEIKNIIWLRTDSIGDNILASSMLKHIKKEFPEANLTVVCQDHIKELYEFSPYADHIIGFNKTKMVTNLDYKNYIFKKINKKEADLFLNSIYSSEPLTHEFVFSSNASIKVGFNGDLSNISENDKEKCNLFYTHLIQPHTLNIPEIKRHKEFLAAIGINCNTISTEIWLTDEDEKWADKFFEMNDLKPQETIAVYAGAQHTLRIYEKFGEALKGLSDKNEYHMILLGGKDDIVYNEHIENEIEKNIINLTGTISLRKSAAILRRCRISIGTETALAHIACAVGTKNIVLLGGGHFGRFLPYSELTTLITLPLDCYGCNWNCIYKTAHCVKDIDPEIISEVVQNMLFDEKVHSKIFIQKSSISEEQFQKHFNNFIKSPEVEIVPVGNSKINNYEDFVVSTKNNLNNENNTLAAAEIEIEAGNLIKAKEILEKLLLEDDKDTLALNDLAVVNILSSEYKEAMKILNTVLSIDPKNDVAIGNIEYLVMNNLINQDFLDEQFKLIDKKDNENDSELQWLQSNWNTFGKTDPMWAVLTDPSKKNNGWKPGEFFETGINDIDNIFRYTENLRLKIKPGRALDFGCGVGRLSQALAMKFNEVYGVDIAPSMIESANYYNRFNKKCKYILNSNSDLSFFPENYFDFIYTIITLQHMKPVYSEKFIKEFMRILKPEGILIFQIPSRRINEYVPVLEESGNPSNTFDPENPVMEMHGIYKDNVLKILNNNNGEVVHIENDTSLGNDWESFRYCVKKI